MMKRLSMLMVFGICFCCLFIFSSNIYAADAEWVNNQGCYCGGYAAVPVSYVSRGSGSLAERTATQDQMEYWNLYADIYSPTSLGTGLGAPNNGINEVNTFITQAQAQSTYGYNMSSSTYGVAILMPDASFGFFNECKDFVATDCGPFTETDVLINADFPDGWTTDPNDYNHALVQTTALHEIGHTWGAHHVFTLPVFGDSYSTMNYINDDSGRFVTRMDANTIRAHYPGVATTGVDVGIFPLVFGNSDYAETYASVSPTSVSVGGSLNVSNFLIQNIGTQAANNTVITFYLSTDSTVEDTDHDIGTVSYSSLPVDADNDLNAALTIPGHVPDGTYYIGAIVTVDSTEDSIGINNRFIIGRPNRTQITVSSLTDPITHTLTPPSATTVSQGGILGPFFASATNNTASDYTFELRPYLITPDSNWHLMFTNEVTLGAGGTSLANSGNEIYMAVPPSGPTGSHSHCVRVYDTTPDLIDEDCFSFEVTESPSRFQLFKSRERLRRLMRTPGAQVVEKYGWKMIIIPKRGRPLENIYREVR